MNDDKLTICDECGFPKEWNRDLVILDSNPLSITSMLENKCEECGHFKDGSTILKIKPLLQKYQKAGKKTGRTQQKADVVKLIEKRIDEIQKHREELSEEIVNEKNIKHKKELMRLENIGLHQISEFVELKSKIKEMK